ncbi:MAG: hypothetical protein WCJ97_11815, partial [Phycisphaerae bacterium]
PARSVAAPASPNTAVITKISGRKFFGIRAHPYVVPGNPDQTILNNNITQAAHNIADFHGAAG